MAIGGKLIGGALGLILGGPIGAILGAVTGHQVDRLRRDAPKGRALSKPRFRLTRNEESEILFVTSLTVLAAKLSKVDGVSSPVEFQAFSQRLRMQGRLTPEVARVFEAAKFDAHGFEECARQIAELLNWNKFKLLLVLELLVAVAVSDGQYSAAEREFIHRVATIFGFAPDIVRQFEAMHSVPAQQIDFDPYEVLGLTSSASNDDVRKSYRKLVRESHPDVAQGNGLPEELVAAYAERMKKVNAAYKIIRQERKLGD